MAETALTPFEMIDLGPEPPASAREYGEAFAHRDMWSGGDIAAPILLPQTNAVLWVFGDSFVGGIDADRTPTDGMVRNALVKQEGGRFTMFLRGTGPYDLEAPMPASKKGMWLWPTGGIADSTYCYITALRMADGDGDGPWNWLIDGLDVVKLRWKTMKHIYSRPAPIDQDAPISWSGHPVKIGRYAYHPGWQREPWHQVLARSSIESMGNPTSPWVFWDGKAWSPDIAKAVAPAGETPFGTWSLMTQGSGVVASAKTLDAFTDDLWLWSAPSVTGPYTKLTQAVLSTHQSALWYTYAGRVVRLPGAGLVSMWSRNSDEVLDARTYGPVFANCDGEAAIEGCF